MYVNKYVHFDHWVTDDIMLHLSVFYNLERFLSSTVFADRSEYVWINQGRKLGKL